MIRRSPLTYAALTALLATSCSTTQHPPESAATAPATAEAESAPSLSTGEDATLDFGIDEFAALDDLLDAPSDELAAGPGVNDPFEPANRAIFNFNDKAYRHVLSPVSKTYAAIVPTPVRSGIVNVFDNVRYPERMANQLLQGKPGNALRETGRFIVDSTFGLGGIARPSANLPALQVPAEDTGQTLGTWGVGEGPYLVLPLLGPSNLRDGIGLVGDTLLDPISYLDADPRYITRGSEIIAESPQVLRTYDTITAGALDPYTATREGYTSVRRNAIAE